MEWSFLFPSVSPVFFQIGTVTYQHRLRFRWRGFMYEFLPLIRKARTRCDLTGFHLAARSAQVLSLGRLACWRSSRPGARGLSARFHTLSLSRAPRLCPVAVDITILTRRKLRLEEVYSERLSQKHFQRQLLISAMRFLKLSRFLNPKQLRFRLLIMRFIPSTGPCSFKVSGILVKQPPVCLQYLVFPYNGSRSSSSLGLSLHCQRSFDQLYDVEAVYDDPGIRKQCLDELDVLGIQVDNYGFHRSSFPVRVAVHEVLPDCLRQSVFKNSHDVMTSFSVAADE